MGKVRAQKCGTSVCGGCAWFMTTAVQAQKEESEVQAKIRNNSFPLKDCLVWVHMASDCLHCVAHWIVDHPCDLGNAKEMPTVQMATELGLFNNPWTPFYLDQSYFWALAS